MKYNKRNRQFKGGKTTAKTELLTSIFLSYDKPTSHRMLLSLS